MEYYGNIITFFDCTKEQLGEVSSIIEKKGYPYLLIDKTFYLGTPSIVKFKVLEKEISDMGHKYVFYFVKDSNGDDIKGNRLEAGVLKRIKDIFFNDI